MKDPIHIGPLGSLAWCGSGFHHGQEPTMNMDKATCLKCLHAFAEAGSEARHRYEVLREAGAKP